MTIGNSQFDHRILGPGRTLAEALKENPNIRVKDSPADKVPFQVQEAQRLRELNGKLDELRNNPDKIVGQVIVNGEVFAAVYASGSAVTRRSMPMPEQGSGMDLAKARLNAIAKAVNGTIRQTDFLPNPWEGPQPAAADVDMGLTEFDLAHRRV